MSRSFSSVAGSNLDKAPPSASPRPVARLPVYPEEDVYRERAKRDARRRRQMEPEPAGMAPLSPRWYRPILCLDMRYIEITPEMEPLERKRAMQQGREGRPEKEEPTTKNMIVKECIRYFDKNQRGKITMWDTFRGMAFFCHLELSANIQDEALRRMGYSWILSLPATLIMHLRLSPLTAPYRFPFLYRTVGDLLGLPIYTEHLPHMLAYRMPLPSRSQINSTLDKYGQTSPDGGPRGLGLWGGFRALAHRERLQWWQLMPW